jgi:hypothetical protein
MAKLGYGYKERDVDTTLNWFEIGQQVSNVILENDKRRKEEKAAIDTATREFMETLNNAPQGINQDANNFTNNFASDMMKQAMIDEKLLKSGQMDLNTYMLRRNNYIDGTKRLYNLQKLYQENAQKIMDEIDADEIQSELTFFNMKSVEGYADFNNSKATIDSLGDGKIGMALYENKIIDGKPMKVLSKNMAPVNVIEGKIMSRPKKFKTDAATTRIADSLGVKEGALYKAATTSGAGTITNFLGIEAMGTQYETFKGVIDATNEAIDGQIKASLSNPYNLTSVLAQDTGKYNSSSFTYDRDEAQKDPSKILLKIDPSTTQPIMDADAPHYDAQFKEASEWMRKDILSKMDRKIDIKTTAQLQDQSAAWKNDIVNKNKDEEDITTMIGTLWGGSNDADMEKASTAFRDINPNVRKIIRTPQGIEVILIGPSKKEESHPISFYGKDGSLMSQEDFIQAAAPLLAGNINARSAIRRGGYLKGAKFNSSSSVEAEVRMEEPPAERDYTPEVKSYAQKNTSKAIKAQDATQTAVNLASVFGKLGFKFESKEDTGLGTKDNIVITSPDGVISPEIPVDDDSNVGAIIEFITNNSQGQDYSKIFTGSGSGANLNASQRRGK